MNAPQHKAWARLGAIQRGLSLIELMVALVIGSVLIAGAVVVYSKSKKSYGESESVARLQETARFAMSVIETDVRMANNFGLLKSGNGIAGKASQNVLPLSPMVATAALNLCGTNFVVDLDNPIQADNDQYVLSNTRFAGCNSLADYELGTAWTTTPVTTADTLTIRRSSGLPSAATVGALQLCTTRQNGQIENDGSGCVAAPNGMLTDLIYNSYYIDQNSRQLAGLPSLRRKTLATIAGVAQLRDQEVIAGIEDMQIQLGLDTTGSSGTATQYIDPVFPLPANSQVVAVRIWLLVRSDVGENGFIDGRVYQYGDRSAANGTTGNLNAAAAAGLAYSPASSADASFFGPQHARRLLISRTIMLRNAQGT